MLPALNPAFYTSYMYNYYVYTLLTVHSHTVTQTLIIVFIDDIPTYRITSVYLVNVVFI